MSPDNSFVIGNFLGNFFEINFIIGLRKQTVRTYFLNAGALTVILHEIFNRIEPVNVSFNHCFNKFGSVSFGRLFEVIFIFKKIFRFGERFKNIFDQPLLYDIDEMYADFSKIDAEQIEKLRATICEQSWHLMDSLERMSFLEDNLPWNLVNNYGELLCDFRSGGYRILGDLVCDIDDANTDTERRILVRDDDTELWKSMIKSYHKRSVGDSYRDAVSEGCRQYLETKIKPSEAVKYAIALGKNKFVFDVLLDKVAENVLPYKEV